MMSDYPDSWYAASAGPAPRHEPLAGEVSVDVCVIGAGFTGISAALHLAERGYGVAVLEAERVGWGASGRNGGQICTGYNKDMAAIEARVGGAAAQICWDIAEESKALIRERVARHEIACELKWGYLHAANKPGRLDGLKRHADEYARYGYEGCEILGKAALEERLGSRIYHGALWEPGAGHLHPLNYNLGLAGAATAAGARIFEKSAAVRIETGARPVVHTAAGSVRAKFLVLAGNAYLGALSKPLYRRIMPVGSYILATEPLGKDRAKSLIRGDDAVSDSNFIVDYYRLSGDNRMLFGGRASYSTCEPADLFAFMRPRMLNVFPQLADVRADYCWGGDIGITVDRMPDVGRLGDSVFYAQGYSGQGVALSGMCGKLIAEAIAGQAERFDVLARFRHPPFPGGKLRTPLLVLAMLWYRLRDALT